MSGPDRDRPVGPEVSQVFVGKGGVEAQVRPRETDLVEEDHGLSGLELAEEEAEGAICTPPVGQQLLGDLGGAP